VTIDSESNERHPIEILADEFSLRLRKGEHPTIEEYALKHPEFAELIRSLFPSIALVERVAINEDQVGAFARRDGSDRIEQIHRAG
jgi:hypothetical protein